MGKINIPKRAFVRGENKPVSIRLPAELQEVLETLASASGIKMPDLIRAVLDQYAQQEVSTKQKTLRSQKKTDQ